MLVFKFGGASVKDADAVKNVAKIISLFPKEKKLVVVSAMGKTTNAMEEIVEALWHNKKESYRYLVDQVYQYHVNICEKLFPGQHEGVKSFLDELFDSLQNKINQPLKREDILSENIINTKRIRTRPIRHYA